MPLRIQECEYPNGATYGVFFMGPHKIGRARKMLEELRMYCGGALPPDGSKPPNEKLTGAPGRTNEHIE